MGPPGPDGRDKDGGKGGGIDGPDGDGASGKDGDQVEGPGDGPDGGEVVEPVGIVDSDTCGK